MRGTGFSLAGTRYLLGTALRGVAGVPGVGGRDLSAAAAAKAAAVVGEVGEVGEEGEASEMMLKVLCCEFEGECLGLFPLVPPAPPPEAEPPLVLLLAEEVVLVLTTEERERWREMAERCGEECEGADEMRFAASLSEA